MSLEVEPWKDDENAFLAHFDIPHPEFCTLITVLSEDQLKSYEEIRKVHEEAAILWAIHEGKTHGILKDSDEIAAQDQTETQAENQT